MSLIKHSGTLSSNGIETTPSTNYIITFSKTANGLVFTAVDTLNFKINSETNYHYLFAGDTLNIQDMEIRKIEIKEIGVKYVYHALCY